jgi:hypothetical protein
MKTTNSDNIKLSAKAKMLIPRSQLTVTLQSKEIMDAVAAKLNDIAANLPTLYATEGKKDTLITVHYCYRSTDFYVLEFDGEDTFFGFMILNGDRENAELGYQCRSELFHALPLLNLDYWFKPKTLQEIKNKII